MIQAINRWLQDSGKRYQDGVALLEKYCNNAHMIREFSNRSPRFAMDDLIGVLNKINKEISDIPDNCQKPTTTELPKEVVDAKREVHNLWVEISKLNERLYNVGEENSNEAIEERRKLLEDRLTLIEKYNKLYMAKEEYFKSGVIPVVEEKKEDSVDYSQMKDIDLLKALKAAKQYISRCENQLKYQKNTRGKDNPMPPCPKRDDIEKRLASKIDEYSLLCNEYERRCGNGTH